MENPLILTIVLLFIGAYAVLYMGGKKYLENFEGRFHQDGSPNVSAMGTTTQAAHAAQMPLSSYPQPSARPSPEMHQNPPDEYEVSAVYQNQGSREASQKQINDAMTRYPLDWSVQGPNSQTFQENLVQYTKETNYATQPAPFRNTSMDPTLPDTLEMEEEEKKILKTYQPKSSKGLLEYSVDDVKSLVDKVYTKKGLIPIIKKSKQGDNVWEITEVKEKNPKIVWEDDPDLVTRNRMDVRGEEMIQIPYPASDMAGGLNPFVHPRDQARKGKQDVRQWEPEMSQMFQTSRPVPEWK
jgi:hypothetical protein